MELLSGWGKEYNKANFKGYLPTRHKFAGTCGFILQSSL